MVFWLLGFDGESPWTKKMLKSKKPWKDNKTKAEIPNEQHTINLQVTKALTLTWKNGKITGMTIKRMHEGVETRLGYLVKFFSDYRSFFLVEESDKSMAINKNVLKLVPNPIIPKVINPTNPGLEKRREQAMEALSQEAEDKVVGLESAFRADRERMRKSGKIELDLEASRRKEAEKNRIDSFLDDWSDEEAESGKETSKSKGKGKSRPVEEGVRFGRIGKSYKTAEEVKDVKSSQQQKRGARILEQLREKELSSQNTPKEDRTAASSKEGEKPKEDLIETSQSKESRASEVTASEGTPEAAEVDDPQLLKQFEEELDKGVKSVREQIEEMTKNVKVMQDMADKIMEDFSENQPLPLREIQLQNREQLLLSIQSLQKDRDNLNDKRKRLEKKRADFKTRGDKIKKDSDTSKFKLLVAQKLAKDRRSEAQNKKREERAERIKKTQEYKGVAEREYKKLVKSFDTWNKIKDEASLKSKAQVTKSRKKDMQSKSTSVGKIKDFINWKESLLEQDKANLGGEQSALYRNAKEALEEELEDMRKVVQKWEEIIEGELEDLESKKSVKRKRVINKGDKMSDRKTAPSKVTREEKAENLAKAGTREKGKEKTIVEKLVEKKSAALIPSGSKRKPEPGPSVRIAKETSIVKKARLRDGDHEETAIAFGNIRDDLYIRLYRILDESTLEDTIVRMNRNMGVSLMNQPEIFNVGDNDSEHLWRLRTSELGRLLNSMRDNRAMLIEVLKDAGAYSEFADELNVAWIEGSSEIIVSAVDVVVDASNLDFSESRKQMLINRGLNAYETILQKTDRGEKLGQEEIELSDKLTALLDRVTDDEVGDIFYVQLQAFLDKNGL